MGHAGSWYSSCWSVSGLLVMCTLFMILGSLPSCTNGQFFTKTAKSIPRMGRRSDTAHTAPHAISPWLRNTLHQIFALTRNKPSVAGHADKYRHPLYNDVLTDDETSHKFDLRGSSESREALRYRWREQSSESSERFDDPAQRDRQKHQAVSLLAQFKDSTNQKST